MKEAMLEIVARLQNALASGEEGQWNGGPYVGWIVAFMVLLILLIVAGVITVK